MNVMGLSNGKMMLIYGFSQEEILKIAEAVLSNNLINFKVVDRNMTTMKVKNILDGVTILTEGNKVFNQKVILFNNLEDDEVKNTLSTLKKYVDSSTIFAVVTEHSIKWTFEELLEHLCEEKKWAESIHKK